MPIVPGARAALVVVGALHVDELAWPESILVPRASNPVRWTRRPGGVGANVARAAAVQARAVAAAQGESDGPGPRESADVASAARAIATSGAERGTADTAALALDAPAAGTRARPVVLVAAVGDDDDARWLEASLREDGVDCRTLAVAGRPSGRYTVVHDAAGELFVGLADTGLAESVDADGVRERLGGVQAAAIVLDANLSPGCIAALLAGGPVGSRLRAAASAPRVALAVSPAKAARLARHAAAVDLLFCNRREAAALGGRDVDAPLGTHADALVAAGFARFVLSDGAAPVLVQTPRARALVEVPPVAAARSVNGAGDALAGATLARWLDGPAGGTGAVAGAAAERDAPAAGGAAAREAAREGVTSIGTTTDGDERPSAAWPDDAALADAVREAGLPAAAAVLGGPDGERTSGATTPGTP